LKEYDYIVVGAGTSGCVVASRLAQRSGNRVLLLEAGPSDRHWTIQMPSAFGRNFEGGPYNWGFWTTPQKHLDGRKVFQPRGRALGGSSAINGMVYLRGHALDYDRWAKKGATGWSYADVLPYFKRGERYSGGGDAYRGGQGPVSVLRGTVDNPLDHAFLKAGQEAGYPLTSDVNGYQQEGFGCWDMNIDNGVRASSAHAYLKTASWHPKVDIVTGARLRKLEFSGKRVVGVRYEHHGVEVTARAQAEVILSAGAVHSPQLLMLSGIGPADHLRDMGIKVHTHLPGVGENLQDHMYMMIQYESKQPVTLNKYARLDKQAVAGIQWFASKTGPLSTNHVEVGAFFRSRAGIEHPDVQIHFKPVLLEGWQLSKTHGYNFGAGTLRATSVGSLRLNSADPNDAPLIDPNYLATQEDIIDMRNALKLTREVAMQDAFAPFRGREITPGSQHQSDKEIDAYIRANAGSGYHLCGTCRMGTDDLSVCAPDLKVHGLEGLRVIDASIFPDEPSANTNAPSFMVGERGADLVLGNGMLRAENIEIFESPRFAVAQR